MGRRKEVEDAVLRILADEVSDVPWGAAVAGAKRGRSLEGTVACDRVSFKADAKDGREATAVFSVYVIDGAGGGRAEETADKADAVLAANPTLDGWATDSFVRRMFFGVAQGKPEIGVALLELEVKFDMKESGG
jgi:hypothetical protein